MPDSPHTRLLEQFPSISLAEMDGVKLMNRIDNKYVTDTSMLTLLLSDALALGYRVLEVGGKRVNHYNSLYFDTPALKMYTDHQNRRLTRQKVRTRVYASSGLTFLEVKRKNNHGRTRKKRMVIPSEAFDDFRAIPEACSFLAEKSDYTADMLCPRVTTAFDRITLVNAGLTERLTIDFHLHFHNVASGLDAGLGRAVIIELKQDGHAGSRMKQGLLEHRIKPLRVSKYCIGTVLTDPDAKKNRFKQKIKQIEKVIHEKIEVQCES